MRLSKLGYYADLVVYPIIVVALTAAGCRGPHSRFFVVFSLCCLMGFAGWTLVEYAVHRFVLHRVSSAARLHDVHHANPVALVGTPSWLSLAAFALVAFVPLWASGGLEIATGVVAGLMLGYMWYMVVHHAVHRWPLDRGSLLYRAKLRHAVHHHHRERDGNFGVTTGFWDRLFATAIERAPGRSANRLA